MATQRIVKCKFCEKRLKDEELYALHIERVHPEQILPDMVPRQFVYYLRTGKTHGTCVICKKDTEWNPATNKYHRFCDDPTCKEKYKEMFNNRMISKYGKTSLLDDPEQQKKMLAARKISGVYYWSDRVHQFTYTGSYEKTFIEFLDTVLNFSPKDIFMPSPHTYWYEYEGERHFYIPDVYIASLDVEIEVKDGGDNPNMHHKIVEVDKEKERLKDEVMRSKSVPFNYVKIINKNNLAFLKYLEEAKSREIAGIKKKIVMEDEVIVC